jgi:cyanate lyase
MSSVSKKPEKPKATDYPQATSPPVKSPRRYPDPELAQAIKEAKLKTGSSWRRVAKYTGLSHSYLVQLSNGQRVPSRKTVEVLAEWLPMENWAVEQLRDVAARS